MGSWVVLEYIFFCNFGKNQSTVSTDVNLIVKLLEVLKYKLTQDETSG